VFALLAQLAYGSAPPRERAERAAALLADHPDVAIAVFPELYLSGYTVENVEAVALDREGAELRAVREAAASAKTAVVVGFAERAVAGVANAVACIDADGDLVAVYRKTQLFGAERDAFMAGDELVVTTLAGRRIGPLVCFDVEFPELARQATVAGADLLVTASANMEPFFGDHEVATRSRALENRVPHLYANAVGECRGVRFVGGSRSVLADGTVAAAADHARDEALVAPVGERGAADERVDYLRHLPGRLRVVA
jgi:predicted amidohydrolase